MISLLPKRRVLYIRHKRGKAASDGLRMNQDEWVETLSLHADVRVQTEDFDMGEICDRLRPDFIVYESPGHIPLPLSISNPRARLDIPRFGFQMQDPHDTARVFFHRQLDHLNIEWQFSHLTEALMRQSPELQGRVYSLPLLFDETLFYDYKMPKDIPVSVYGGMLGPDFYAWRHETVSQISDYFPTLVYTHPGYDKPTPRHKFEVVGEAYARGLNRSHFSLADSTRLDYLVRKHLEIPASGSVLIAPDAEVLKPYGFKDMENCILGSGKILFEKIALVADNPEQYERIKSNGYNLVHSKYGRKNWRGFLDFYECWRTLRPCETIQQEGLLGPFKVVPNGPNVPAIAASIAESQWTLPMKEAQRLIAENGSLELAQNELKTVSLWLGHITEQWILLGIIALLRGMPQNAKQIFLKPMEIRKARDGLVDFDPAEIAWLSLTALLMNDEEALSLRQKEGSNMKHLSLRRMEWLHQVLALRVDISALPEDLYRAAKDDLISIHWMNQIEIKSWLTLIERILIANGRPHKLN